MAKAKNLRELLLIRAAELDYINSITGNLGSALGLKNGDGDPCVIVFVEQKIDSKWLKSGQLIKKTLEGPGGLTCPADVVQGRKYQPGRDIHLLDIMPGMRFWIPTRRVPSGFSGTSATSNSRTNRSA